MAKYIKIDQESFANKHHMSTNSNMYHASGAGNITMFLNNFIGIPDYIDGERSHIVNSSEILRFDNISYKYYGTPELFWVIMSVNNIINPFNVKPGTVLRILPISYIEYNLLRYHNNT